MNILLCGASGRMGREIVKQAQVHGDTVTSADPRRGLPSAAFADVLIDFSHPDATAALLSYAVKDRLPLCIGTTGQDKGQLRAIAHAAEQIPVLHAATFSLGIVLLKRLIGEVLRVFPDAQAEIVETHHVRKSDAPSGTALALAETIRAQCPDRFPRLGRSGSGTRDEHEIGIHSLRLGRTVGIHEVLFDLGEETLSLRHEVHDRASYAVGAYIAAKRLTELPPGLYGVEQIITAQREERA